jgi:hypothetical protein
MKRKVIPYIKLTVKTPKQRYLALFCYENVPVICVIFVCLRRSNAIIAKSKVVEIFVKKIEKKCRRQNSADAKIFQKSGSRRKIKHIRI